MNKRKICEYTSTWSHSRWGSRSEMKQLSLGLPRLVNYNKTRNEWVRSWSVTEKKWRKRKSHFHWLLMDAEYVLNTRLGNELANRNKCRRVVSYLRISCCDKPYNMTRIMRVMHISARMRSYAKLCLEIHTYSRCW